METGIFLSVFATVVSLVSVYFSAKSARHAKDAVISSIILDIIQAYTEDDVRKGIRHLFKSRNDDYDLFRNNRYEWARKYLEKVDEDSEDWRSRRKVLFFWNRIGALLKTGLLSEDLVFTLFPNVEIIEILEAIEIVFAEKYSGIGDRYIGLVYKKWQKWLKKAKHTKELLIPLDPQAYAKSKITS